MQGILTADIGGTYSRFAGFTLGDDGTISRLNAVSLTTSSFSSFDDLIEEALMYAAPASGSSWEAMVLAVPGLVRDGVPGILPNVPWLADIRTLKTKMPETEIHLINDFVAQAYACLLETGLAGEVIQEGRSGDGGVIAVVGAGTGLGHCAIRKGAGDSICVIPSEAGHAAFPFYRGDEARFMEYLMERTGIKHPHNDLVVSGPGLAHLHAWLTGEMLPPNQVVRRIGPDSETTEFFARFYARACKNYVLNTLSTGGLFITGGVAMRNPFLVMNDSFREEFIDAPHYQDMLETIPVSLVCDEDVGLLGAVRYGMLNLRG
ncbi:glucokinase [Methanocalculus sp.]|uniref:glucokinase n=1 Tax=Methanocalculus sp. TaxID=2004547 RepID=UPI00260275E3|nr:glucokinase [Methanocalculus sp.]MDG6250194.1 glucokinase [Methanocalculus sp.]